MSQSEHAWRADADDPIFATANAAERARKLRTIAEGLERDRREPDKVLLYVADLRRLADDEAGPA